MQHVPVWQPSSGALYTVPEEEEEAAAAAAVGTAAQSPATTDPVSEDAGTGVAEAKQGLLQESATGPARASGRRADPGAGSLVSMSATPWSAMPWPAGRLAGGFLELRGGSRPDRRSKSALCTIQDGMLSFWSDPRSGEDDMVLAAMNVKGIVVTVFRNAPRQFVISSCLDPAFHERTLFRHTRIHCMASSQQARNKWLAVLHRTGVHLHGEMEDGSIRRVRQGVPQAEQ